MMQFVETKKLLSEHKIDFENLIECGYDHSYLAFYGKQVIPNY